MRPEIRAGFPGAAKPRARYERRPRYACSRSAERGRQDPSMAKVELTTHLYQFFPNLEQRPLAVPGATVRDVLRGLEALAPGFAFYVCDERGRLRQHVLVFIGDQPVRDRATLTDPVAPDERVLILQALSGG
jgi:hypothetical protein